MTPHIGVQYTNYQMNLSTYSSHIFTNPDYSKVEIFLEKKEAAFLSPSKICENLDFSTEIQFFTNFAG